MKCCIGTQVSKFFEQPITQFLAIMVLVKSKGSTFFKQARRKLNWNGGGGSMDSQYKLLSELLSDQAAFITSPKTSLANYWGACPLPPVSTGLLQDNDLVASSISFPNCIRSQCSQRGGKDGRIFVWGHSPLLPTAKWLLLINM